MLNFKLCRKETKKMDFRSSSSSWRRSKDLY